MSFKDQLEADWKIIKDRDAIAKMNDTLIGRYIKFQYADSHAFYEVWAISGDTAHVQHIDYCDGWTFPMIEQMGCQVPVTLVKANIDERESWEELFKK